MCVDLLISQIAHRSDTSDSHSFLMDSNECKMRCMYARKAICCKNQIIFYILCSKRAIYITIYLLCKCTTYIIFAVNSQIVILSSCYTLVFHRYIQFNDLRSISIVRCVDTLMYRIFFFNIVELNENT